jgi:hypothetical protein
MLPVKPVAENVTCCPGAINALFGFTVKSSWGVSVALVQPAINIAREMKEKI